MNKKGISSEGLDNIIFITIFILALSTIFYFIIEDDKKLNQSITTAQKFCEANEFTQFQWEEYSKSFYCTRYVELNNTLGFTEEKSGLIFMGAI